VGRAVNSVTFTVPLLSQGKAHLAGNGMPFPMALVIRLGVIPAFMQISLVSSANKIKE
jgi:hypothetical protein